MTINVLVYLEILQYNIFAHMSQFPDCHSLLYIGADLAVILKTKEQLEIASKENPFKEAYDYSGIRLVFTNDQINKEKLAVLVNTAFEGEIFGSGTECLYMCLPRDAAKKKQNTNYLERKIELLRRYGS